MGWKYTVLEWLGDVALVVFSIWFACAFWIFSGGKRWKKFLIWFGAFWILLLVFRIAYYALR